MTLTLIFYVNSALDFKASYYIQYYINKRDWIAVIRSIMNCYFLTAFVVFIALLRGKRAAYIRHIHPNAAQQFQVWQWLVLITLTVFLRVCTFVK